MYTEQHMTHPVQELLELLPTITEAEKNLIIHAYNYSKTAHEKQERNNGEPYFNHVFHVACILAKMDADITTICAGFSLTFFALDLRLYLCYCSTCRIASQSHS